MKERNRGFTLIELVISVGILALIISTAYSSLSQIMDSKKILDDEREIYATANAIFQRMTREIQQISVRQTLLPPAESPDSRNSDKGVKGENKNLDGSKKGSTMTIVAENSGQYIPDGKSHTGLVQITYRVEKDPENPNIESYLLIRDEIPYQRPAADAYKKIMTFPVTNKISSLDFEYYNLRTKEWEQEWKNKNYAPRLIKYRVSLISETGKEHHFSSIVVVPN